MSLSVNIDKDLLVLHAKLYKNLLSYRKKRVLKQGHAHQVLINQLYLIGTI